MKALETGAQFLQRELGKRLTTRRTPALSFLIDEALEEGSRIMHLLDEVRDQDSPSL